MERIVDATVALADEHGLAAVSMERVASEFHFPPWDSNQSGHVAKGDIEYWTHD